MGFPAIRQKISYEQASSQSKETYAQIDKKPSTWSKDYTKYYFRKTTNPITYATYSQATSTEYSRVKNKPKTWGRDYSLYYMLITDGVTTDYQQCSSVNYNGYALQKINQTTGALISLAIMYLKTASIQK